MSCAQTASGDSRSVAHVPSLAAGIGQLGDDGET